MAVGRGGKVRVREGGRERKRKEKRKEKKTLIQ